MSEQVNPTTGEPMDEQEETVQREAVQETPVQATAQESVEQESVEAAPESAPVETPAAAPVVTAQPQTQSRSANLDMARADDDSDDSDDDEDESEDGEDESSDSGYVEGPAEYIQREKSGRGRRIGGDVRAEDVDYKNIPMLSRFLDRRGRILGRRKTRVSAKVQRRIVQAIKRARHLALLPYTAEQTRIVRKRR